MKTLRQYKKEQLKNPSFRKSYEENIPMNNLIRAMVDVKKSKIWFRDMFGKNK